jgi:chorismate mutase
VHGSEAPRGDGGECVRRPDDAMSTYLEKRLAELNQEIRTYPGPIARCDEHLPALLEERARLMAELERESGRPIDKETE